MEVFHADGTQQVPYTLTGANCQILSLKLKPGEVAHSEPGTMMTMSNNIDMGLSCKFEIYCIV